VFIVLGAGTVLLIAGTYLVLRRLVLHPLDRLARASRAVAEGRQPEAVPRPVSNDEVGALVDDFNRMAQEVHEYQTRLEERVLDALKRAMAAEGRLVIAQRLAATGTLAAGFAHEINNPVGGMVNALRKLREGNLSPERREEYFDLALDGLSRIRTIVERILHFTPRQSEPADVDVLDACRRAVQLARHRAEQRSIAIVVEADAADGRDARAARAGRVVGDAQELTQAFLNLLLNAVDAFPDGRAGTVTVRASTTGSDAVVEVTDDGAGMDPETARRCVDLFYTTKPEGEGTGLGLAIVQHIVTDHGGSLGIESELGKGTTVRIVLPRSD
jgi:signal transduction histidine kinase